MNAYPLVFEPIFKPKIWGGRTLEILLGKRLPAGEAIGESWELADLEDDQSMVANGPAKGRTLGELVKEWGADLIGGAELFEGRFPLLIKFLDARDTLSVQVHPDAAMARRLGGRVRLKNEAWYIVDADEGSFIYRGVQQGVDGEALRRAIEGRDVASCLKRIDVRQGHCYYLPSGTIHALGAGVTVAEIQTPSDVTYRVYDWDRVDPSTGAPRELHVERAMECISYDTSPIPIEHPEHVGDVWTSVTSLVRCESFVVERVRATEGLERELGSGEFVIWMVLEGRGQIMCKGHSEPVEFGRGDTVLLPAGLNDARFKTLDDCMWLEVSVPVTGSAEGAHPGSLGKPEQADQTRR
ncbi:MAG: class I mannose-6-phosphate isomerase [Planctomycetes bacterium]|nr:class I mannose-6-phosphate isomerase [Planctomycetota bacterium]